MIICNISQVKKDEKAFLGTFRKDHLFYTYKYSKAINGKFTSSFSLLSVRELLFNSGEIENLYILRFPYFLFSIKFHSYVAFLLKSLFSYLLETWLWIAFPTCKVLKMKIQNSSQSLFVLMSYNCSPSREEAPLYQKNFSRCFYT